MKHDLKYLDTFEIQSPSKDPSFLHSRLPLRETPWRWVALVMMNLIVLGDFVALEGPQPIETQIKELLHLNEEQYGMLYSSWALPSIFSPLIGGYLTDRCGVRPTLIIFSIAVTVGIFIQSFGGYSLDFGWMVIGRMIYALGTDPLNVAQIVITNKWFQGKEIALAMGVSGLTFGIGRGINSFFTPIIYDMTKNLGTPMMFSTIICLVGTFATFIMVKWDRQNDELELERDPSFLSSVEEQGEKIQIRDIKHFKPIVWTLILYFGLIFGNSFSFNSFSNDFYHAIYDFTNIEAGTIIASNFVVMALAASLFGKLIDKYGKRATMLLYNSFLGVIAFSYFFINSECSKCYSSILPQLLFGLQLGIAEAAIYPALPLVLDEKYLGTGYGLFFVLENILVLFLTMAGAAIKDATEDGPSKGYFGLLIFFFVWNCALVFAGIKLFRESNNLNRVLDKVVKQDLDETTIEETGELLSAGIKSL